MRQIPNWSEYFMGIAEAVSKRSKDPNTQVGSVIVDKNKHIIATGYNGMAPGMIENDSIWTKENKAAIVVHSEANCLLNAVKSVKGATIYCTHKPCQNCSVLLSAAGIKEVVYKNDRLQDNSEVYLTSLGIKIRVIK